MRAPEAAPAQKASAPPRLRARALSSEPRALPPPTSESESERGEERSITVSSRLLAASVALITRHRKDNKNRWIGFVARRTVKVLPLSENWSSVTDGAIMRRAAPPL